MAVFSEADCGEFVEPAHSRLIRGGLERADETDGMSLEESVRAMVL